MQAKAKAAEVEKQQEEALLAGVAVAGARARGQQVVAQQRRPATAGPAVRGRAAPPPPGAVEMWRARPVGEWQLPQLYAVCCGPWRGAYDVVTLLQCEPDSVLP